MSLAEGRGRRSRNSGRNQKLATLEALKNQRTGVGSRVADFEDTTKVGIYEEVDEGRFEQILAERREREDFIVDDAGNGYSNWDEEDWETADNRYAHFEDVDQTEGDINELRVKRAAKGGSARRQRSSALNVGGTAKSAALIQRAARRREALAAAQPKQRISSMFLGGGAKSGPSTSTIGGESVGPKSSARRAATKGKASGDSDALMENLLAGLASNPDDLGGLAPVNVHMNARRKTAPRGGRQMPSSAGFSMAPPAPRGLVAYEPKIEAQAEDVDPYNQLPPSHIAQADDQGAAMDLDDDMGVLPDDDHFDAPGVVDDMGDAGHDDATVHPDAAAPAEAEEGVEAGVEEVTADAAASTKMEVEGSPAKARTETNTTSSPPRKAGPGGRQPRAIKAEDVADEPEEYRPVKASIAILPDPKLAPARKRAVKRERAPMPKPEDGASALPSWWNESEGASPTKSSVSQSMYATTPSKSASGLKLPIDKETGDLHFYWYDAYEDQWNQPGVVFLFGKVWMPTQGADATTEELTPPEESNASAKQGSYVSCCLRVTNIQRNVYFLPRKMRLDETGQPTDVPVDLEDVEDEIDQWIDHHQFKMTRRATKPVKRKYVFNTRDSPFPSAETGYVKLVYPATDPELPNAEASTWSHMIGRTTTALENFLVKRNLMGPGWIKIKGVTDASSPVSHCKVEGIIASPKDVVRDASKSYRAPPLKVVGLNVKTVMNPETKHNEIVIASLLVHNEVKIDGATPDCGRPDSHMTAIRKLDNRTPLPLDFSRVVDDNNLQVAICGNERHLLQHIVMKIGQLDPDVLVGHNLVGFHLDMLLHRLHAVKPSQWSKFGRLRRSQLPRAKGVAGQGDSQFAVRTLTAGRVLCDTYLSAKEHLRERNYSLKELASTQLKVNHKEIDFSNIPRYFESTPTLTQLISLAEMDAHLSLQLMFHMMVIPLSHQISGLCGNLWTRTLIAGRAERIEHLLLHEFHRLKFIVPEKVRGGGKSGKRGKALYAGGKVLEPKKGLYDKFVLLLDFNSLYPSIIQEYNIDFTTVHPPPLDEEGNPQMADLPDPTLDTGILPRVIRTLIERRRIVKGLIKTEKDSTKLQQHDIRQKALKLVANSMYGCLGFVQSRFYAPALASLITYQGRSILEATVQLTEQKLGLEVVYGDTDSIMVNTNSTDLNEVYQLGNKVKRAVNSLYKKLELEIDGVFERILLLKKKKYAAVIINRNADGSLSRATEMKGLDLVRRDWCGLSKDVGRYLLDQILSDADKEDVLSRIHDKLREVAENVRGNKVPVGKYIITKGLTKAPGDYPDAKAQPHVQVALRMLAGGKIVRAGEYIPYVVCQGADSSAAMRAYHPEDVLDPTKQLTIDTQWYLTQQILPPASRLCDPIEGTNAAKLAECLGLDSSKFRGSSSSHDNEDDGVTFSLDDDAKFKNAEPFTVSCPACKEAHPFEGVRAKAPRTGLGVYCPNPKCKRMYPMAALLNQLTVSIRAHLRKYYEMWFVCENKDCGNRTRQLSAAQGSHCLMPLCDGRIRQDYSSQDLYYQLMFFSRLFDIAAAERKIAEETELAVKKGETPPAKLKMSPTHTAVFTECSAKVQASIDKCDYGWLPASLIAPLKPTQV